MSNHNNNQSQKESEHDNFLLTSQYKKLVFSTIIKELFLPDKNNNCRENNENVDEIILVSCKGYIGIHLCKNDKKIEFDCNDNVIIKIENEYEFATVLEVGKLLNFKREKKVLDDKILSEVERKCTAKDIENNIQNILDSVDARKTFREYITELSLEMKLIDIHYQYDRKKMFFFYTADGRVDFRELAKRLASNFKTRIELRQIGARDEAKRLGGVATCGREFCCSTFINNFKKITTEIAEENNIALKIAKYTGPCGKLKCCLSYELKF